LGVFFNAKLIAIADCPGEKQAVSHSSDPQLEHLMSAASSFESYLSPNIRCVTQDPSRDSTIGDLGYVCEGGKWRAIVNMLNEASCRRLGITAINRTHDLKEYIVKRKSAQFQTPFVTMREDGDYKILTADELEKSLNFRFFLRFRAPDLDGPGIDLAKVGVVLKPLPNRITAAFIGGPYLYVQELQLPYDVIYAWVRRYHSKIRKAARNMMKLSPPQNYGSTIYIATKEYITESWKTVFIRTGPYPDPITFHWRARETGRGMWYASERSQSTSVICGGIGNYPVKPLSRRK
jgi:hypothetical protein